MTCAHPVKATLQIRYPSWASGMTIAVNGQPQAVTAKPGSYVAVARTWKTGDRIDVRLPMHLHTEAMPDDPAEIAILYGPFGSRRAIGFGRPGAADPLCGRPVDLRPCERPFPFRFW